MNIIFFNDVTILGGGEIWVLRMAHALSIRGHRISIVCPHGSPLFRAALEDGIDLYGYSEGPGLPFHEPLYQFLVRRRADLIYCTVIGRFCEAQSLARIVRRMNGHQSRFKTALMLKTGLPPMQGLGAEYYGFGAGQEIRRLHVVSEETKMRFVKWQGGNEAASLFIDVMSEGVDLNRFQKRAFEREKERARWQLKPNQLLIANTSRLQRTKGQEILIYAARDLIRIRPETRLIFAGEGSELCHLEDLCEYLHINSNVVFAGFMEDVRPLLAASDIFCHPSLEDSLPNSVVEAMAMGLPTVASWTGGIPELITHERNGLLVAPRDVAALNKSLMRIAEDADLRVKLGVQAERDMRETRDFSHQLVRWEAAVLSEVTRFREEQGSVVVAPSVYRPEIAYPVLFLLTHLRTGGEETEVALLAQHLDQERFPLSVATGWPINEPSTVVDKLRSREIYVDTSCHAMATLSEKADYLADKIRKNKIRILVACQNTELAYEVISRLRPDECVLIEHAGTAGEVEKIPKDRTAIHIGVSVAIARAAAKMLPDPARARFIPSMVEVDLFDHVGRRRLRSGFGFDKKTVVLFVGRMDIKKGIHLLIEAAKVLLPEFPDLLFIVVGPHDGYQIEYAQGLLDRARQELPKGRFLFTGARDDVPQLMIAADIFALPSVGEGMSHVINEAGAAGLPVIAFDDGAAAEQLAGGAAGVLIPPGDIMLFIQGLRSLISDPCKAGHMGATLRERVNKSYSAKAIVRLWEKVFEEVTTGLNPISHARAPLIRSDDIYLDFPTEIQIETNSTCNATCIMCPYREVSKELLAGQMSLRLYRKILAECAQELALRRIEPFLNNEPFTDSRIIDWIQLAKKTVPHAAVTITSNGSLLRPEDSDRLIYSGLDAIWFSFNGATKETYEKIMGLSFDMVKRNIDYLLSVKPERLKVFTNMIDTVPMRGEIVENIRYWESRGVVSGTSPLVNRAGNVANFDELNYRTLGERAVRTCDLPFHKMYIGFNGDVLLCCMDWRRRVVLGNAGRQTLREIWNSALYRHIREELERDHVDKLDLCSSCTYIRS